MGDQEAWDHLFKTWHQPLLTMTRLFLGPTADDNLVDEIVSRVWYSLISEPDRRLDRYDPSRGCCFTTFLAGFARNEIRQHFRGEQRRRLRERTASREERQPQPLTIGRMESVLDEFFSTLTPREKDFFGSQLMGSGNGVDGEFTDTNAWQLRHRIRHKLEAFLDGLEND